jgi:hypothetical protein
LRDFEIDYIFKIMNLLARSQTLQIYRTVLTVAMIYLVVLTATLSPLKNVIDLSGAYQASAGVICLSDNDHSDNGQSSHEHKSDCCVLCGRHDVASPVLGLIVDTLTIPTRLLSETVRFALFQSRAPPAVTVSSHQARAPPIPA